ncbi:MAG: GNAT family N-acetyltransferase [Bacteroidota bacterium]
MIELCDYTLEFLECSYSWLTDPEIKALTDTPEITREGQLNWFHSLPKLDDYMVWGVMYNGMPVGVCGLKHITADDCEYWGFIGEKSLWGKGLGSVILDNLLGKAVALGKQSVWLRVLKSNKRAIRLYEKFNFLLEKETEIDYFYRLKLEFFDKFTGETT